MKFLKNILSAVIVFWLSVIPSYGDKSVSHYGVTVYFADDHEVGKFANGEPWIIGPATVTAIDKPSIPITTSTTGGAMINPIPGDHPQGFCPRYSGATESCRYDPVLDVSLKYPFTVNAGDSLIVARAIGEEAEHDGGAYRAMVESVVGFTFLAEAPPSGSFRPGLYGKDRRVRFNKDNIDWSVLKNLKPVAATPSQAYIEQDALLPALPWWEWSSEWSGTFFRPIANCGAGDGGKYRSQYGREVAIKWSRVALWLNTSNTQAAKEKTMIQTIQVGLDLASYFSNGGAIRGSGGHQVGRKFPLVLAAAALKNPELLALASDPKRFIEDLTTFIVQQSDIGRPREGGEAAMYIQQDVGLAEWGLEHGWNPWRDDRRWADGVPYRFAQWPAMVGQVLAADLMGLRDLWGHPPIFAYTERFAATEYFGDGFDKQMWRQYKNISASGGNFPSAPQGLRINE